MLMYVINGIPVLLALEPRAVVQLSFMTAFRKGIHVPSRVTRVVRFANDSVTMY